MTRLLFAFLLPAYLAAQTPAPAPEPIHVEGRVLTLAGQPLEGAQLSLRGPRVGQTPATPLLVTTTADGNFSIDAPPAQYSFSVTKTGYLQQSLNLTLTAGQKPTPLSFRLVPAAAITGRVLDREGNPIPKAMVTALRYTYIRGARSLNPAGYTLQANDVGEYRIANLTSGRYYLRVEPLAPGVATYYPSVLDPFAAAPIEVEQGVDRTGIDIRQRVEPVFRIRGKAIDQGGKPAAWAALSILPENPIETLTPPDRVPTAVDGSFEFKNLLPGRYIIRATPNGKVTGADGQLVDALWSGRMAVGITRADVDDLELRLSEGWVLSGSLVMEDDSPLPAGTIRVGLMDAEQTFTSGNVSLRPAEDSRFRIEKVQPGKFYLRVVGPDTAYVKSVYMGGLDVTRSPLDLTFGGADSVRIVLGSKAGEVRVTTKPRVAVALWPDLRDGSTPTSGVRVVTTGEDGIARFTNVRPEKYWVAAFDGVEDAFVRSPEFLNRMKSRAAEMDVAAGASLDRTLEAVDTKTAAAVIQLIP